MSLKVWRNAPAVLVAFLNCAILVTAQDPSVSGSSEPPAGLGARNAINYPGVDIGAKINAAFAACEKKTCTVSVPPGDYHYKTTIVPAQRGISVSADGQCRFPCIMTAMAGRSRPPW